MGSGVTVGSGGNVGGVDGVAVGVAGTSVGVGAGVVGALIADVLFSLFGYLAYLLPVMIAYSGWLVLRGSGCAGCREEEQERCADVRAHPVR